MFATFDIYIYASVGRVFFSYSYHESSNGQKLMIDSLAITVEEIISSCISYTTSKPIIEHSAFLPVRNRILFTLVVQYKSSSFASNKVEVNLNMAMITGDTEKRLFLIDFSNE